MVDITLDYLVHSSEVVDAPVKATVNGVEVEAVVPRLVVELVSVDDEHGHTFRLPVTSQADVLKLGRALSVGAAVRLTISAGDGA